MKNKILLSILFITTAVSTFYIGRNTTPKQETVTKIIVENAQPTEEQTYETYIELMGHIVDWNTNGEELSITTDDDYEFYAYKSQDIYDNRLFIPINQDQDKER